MYAVLETGGKQYRVAAGDTLEIERLSADAGQTFTFDRVLLVNKDGQVAIAVQTQAQWSAMAALLELPADLARQDVAYRLRHAQRIDAKVAEWTSRRTATEAAALLQSAGIPAAPLRSMSDIARDPEVSGRNLVCEVVHPLGGSLKVLGNPMRFSRTPTIASRPAPILGAHTQEVVDEWLLGQATNALSDAES